MILFNDDKLIAGVDEAGRGPWAGPLVVAAVILDSNNPIKGLNDSKKLSEKRRNELKPEIIAKAKAVSIVIIPVSIIDKYNILEATKMGMRLSIAKLNQTPDVALFDGRDDPFKNYENQKTKRKIIKPELTQAIIKGDEKEACIAAASIIAKTVRDEIMINLDKSLPHYGFKNHKGYGTKEHSEALKIYGISNQHRKSFKPIKAYC